jgi:alpha-tubulin suppressor-like RCC1 family protein
MGLGPKNLIVKSPTPMPPPLFGKNEFNPDVKVEKVFSGFFYAGAVTSGGALYIWGTNEAGCLGLGLDDGVVQPFPLKVHTYKYNQCKDEYPLQVYCIY